MAVRPLDQWDWIFQTSPNQATDTDNGTVYHMEVTATENEMIRGQPATVEYITLTNADGVKYRCWRRKSSENNYVIILSHA